MLFVIIGTMYGAKGEDREHDVPVTFMIDPEEWFKGDVWEANSSCT